MNPSWKGEPMPALDKLDCGVYPEPNEGGAKNFLAMEVLQVKSHPDKNKTTQNRLNFMDE